MASCLHQFIDENRKGNKILVNVGLNYKCPPVFSVDTAFSPREQKATVHPRTQLWYGRFTRPYLADPTTSQRKRGSEIAVWLCETRGGGTPPSN